jgi:hypothetical protein
MKQPNRISGHELDHVVGGVPWAAVRAVGGKVLGPVSIALMVGGAGWAGYKAYRRGEGWRDVIWEGMKGSIGVDKDNWESLKREYKDLKQEFRDLRDTFR